MGSFKVVPKQAHLRDFLFKSTFVTPIVVVPKTKIVIHKAMVISNLIKNINPSTVSIKG